MSAADRKLVREAYSQSLRRVFICFTVIAGVCALTGLLIRELKFREDSEELKAEMAANRSEAAAAAVVNSAGGSEEFKQSTSR